MMRWTEMMDQEQNQRDDRGSPCGDHRIGPQPRRDGHLKLATGFDLTDEDRYLLYRACYAAFKACKAKGALQEKAGTHT
jgi:hypothetical protein